MKKAILLLVILFPLALFSCTTFVLKDSNNLVFGRNLDWFSDDGVVVINKKNVTKRSLVFPPEKPVNWTSKYGSVTFNQFGKEFPYGGINEKGLVVEVMVVSGNYPKTDSRSAINESQWVQYQLDNCETIEDVINTDKHLRISKINQSLHYLICDKQGNTAVIEFTKKGMLVYKDDDLKYPVLENDRYKKSLERYDSKERCRFFGATNMVEEYSNNTKTSAIDYSFDILNTVKLDGAWSIVYDIKNMEIHFKTSSNQNIRKIKINEFDFNCKTTSLVYDLMKKDKDEITFKFTPYSTILNEQKLKSAFKSNGIRFPDIILNHIYGYSASCKCSKN
jgi:penicillin V acylase-like amidase (Ntn superfamily)